MELYAEWKLWCATNEAMPGTKPSFDKRLALKQLKAISKSRTAAARVNIINIKILKDELNLGIKGECVLDVALEKNESEDDSDDEEFDDEND